MGGLSNRAIAEVFREVETLLRVLGEEEGRAITYGRVARLIETHPASVADLAAAGALTSVKGIGPAIGKAVAELVDQGTCALRQELEARLSPGILDLLQVPGLGPKRVRAIVDELGVASLEELDAAAADGRLARVRGLGERSAAKVRQGVAFLADTRGLVGLADGWRLARACAEGLGLPGAIVAGAARRGCPIVEELPLVVACDPAKLAASAPGMGFHAAKGGWVRPRGRDPEVRVVAVAPGDLASALFRETGPATHVAAVLARLPKGAPPPQSEEALYAACGLHYVSPERRHVLDGTSPEPPLIERSDLQGLIHCHTRWSDGALGVAEMAEAARERGFAYMGVTDHSRAAAYAGGLSVERLRAQGEEIAAWNARERAAGGRFRVLHGSEVDILPDGALDYPDDLLSALDFVIASVHSSFTQEEAAMTARIERAVRHPLVDILGHPTGMLRLRRAPYAVDMSRILGAAAESRCAIELNANPWRLDIDPAWHARATAAGTRIPINPDAHSADGIDDVEWGVLAARHGGLRRDDVPNTRDAEGFLRELGR